MAHRVTPGTVSIHSMPSINDGTSPRTANYGPTPVGHDTPRHSHAKKPSLRDKWGKNLYPAVPDQTLKDYIIPDGEIWQNDSSGISGLDPDCRIPTRPSPPKKPGCIVTWFHERWRPTFVYVTEQGTFVRAGWTTEFSRRDESMGTLFAKGTARYGNPPDDYDGGTYAVDTKEFDFVTPLTRAEVSKVSEKIRTILSKGEFRMEGKLFKRLDGK